MKHGIKKIKFRKGQDANQALMRKLVSNFVKNGKLETTLHRAKALKSVMDELTFKSMIKTESSVRVILSRTGDESIVNKMFDEIAPIYKDDTRTGGFVRLTRLSRRQGDNADMAILEWTKKPVVEKAKADPAKTKEPVKSAKVEEKEQ